MERGAWVRGARATQVAQVKPGIPLIFRPAGEGDLAYVIRTWIESYRPEQAEMRTSDYEAWMRQRINANVLLACADNEPSVIRGWIAVATLDEVPRNAGPGRLHYVYVRRRYRRQGIARALFEQVTGNATGGEVIVTHMTEAGQAIKRAHPGVFRLIPC